jgi:hypothetical protein
MAGGHRHDGYDGELDERRGRCIVRAFVPTAALGVGLL